MINETYSAFVQGFMPTLARPEVDVLEGLTTAIIVDQQRMGCDPRSTVGTATDANTMLRILFSRLGKPHIGSPQAFSFNVASISGAGAVTIERGGTKTKERRSFSITGGMCPRCEGRGSVTDFDLTQLYDDSKSLHEGALTVPGYSMDGWYGRIYRGCGFFDPDKPIRKFTKKELDDLLYKEPTKIKVDGVNLTYAGLIPQIQKSFLSKDVDAMQPHIRAFVERVVTFTTCPECDGSRLSEAARSSKINKNNIADVCAMEIRDLAEWVRGLDEPSVAPLLTALQHPLDSFVEIGLGYLSLDRPSGTLSGGEAQRTKMLRHLGSSLTDVTYVFDEPTIGLHPHDIQRMNDLLLQLRDKGNTVLVVEHKPETIAIADHVVDLGPGAGTDGGEVVLRGHRRGAAGERHRRPAGTSTTGPPSRRSVRTSTGTLEIRGASTNNLRDVDVDVPLGVLVRGHRRRRLRQELARARLAGGARRRGGGRPGPDPRLAAEQPGDLHRPARPDPQGLRQGQRREAGAVQRQLRGRLPHLQRRRGHLQRPWRSWPASPPPASCARGSGTKRRSWSTSSGGRNIAEVLAMPVTEAEEFFGAGDARTPAAHKILDRLADVGLGYLSLGQPLTTLSGGERQRLKLATQMAEKGDVYVLDEPTTGLHLADVEQLLGLLDRLVDSGKSVIVIAHHQAVMAHADWIIDLGPGAGHDGGRIVFEGTPADLVAARSTLTGEHLAAYVGT